MLSRVRESSKVVSMESITEAEAREFLERSSVIHFGVIAEGEPYVTPMSFVVDGNRLLFRTKPGRRFGAIESEPVVSLEASDFHPESGDWISVIIRGRAAEVTDEETMQKTHDLLFEKYEAAMEPLLSRGEPGLPITPHVFEVSIDEITGRVSATGFSFRTRPGRF
jgi:nitroimidazol reductase NimA-like FMN-containing flavoprotein (pyridoxamine 5'-phosphate oxidase superfamily)